MRTVPSWEALLSCSVTVSAVRVAVHAALFCLSHCGWRAARVNLVRVKTPLLSFVRENDCSGQRMRLVGLCERVGRMV